MGPIFLRRLRSPLLIAVILSIFLHSVTGRHKIRHYKDRFKRQQGAHLYLPGSYVTQGGDGPDAGPWSEWSGPSPCSRTCGGGVSTQYRQCQQGHSCQGPEKRHFSCNTQDCPDTGDFRAQQCSEYDENPFENVKYQWVPYTRGPSPCELNCMPKGQRFYYRHAEKVVDGTRCNDESLDVCVDGECQAVGCDMMLGSNLKEDECRVCGGDGSTCKTETNTLQSNDLQVGYNDILLVPAGATNLVVEELEPSNNYLAIRNTSGHYYLNGNWKIDFPKATEFAGSKFHYERYPQGFAAPDKIFSLGPTEESLFIVLLYQDSSVPIRYKYSVPTNVQPGSEFETYAWTFDEFTPCSATCGGGEQSRNVSCAGRKTLEPVDEKLCDTYKKPDTTRKCNEVACDAQWTPHPWGNCSAPCGEEGGTQTRQISCQQIISNGYPSLVDDSECRGPKPPESQSCNRGKTCAKWYTEPWKPCDHLCGDGKQTRKVQCYIRDESDKIQLLEEGQCQAVEAKPSTEQECFVRPCAGVDWITSEWSGCDNICGLTNETRKIFCATSEGQIYEDHLCDPKQKPEVVRQCESTNSSCNFLWYASQWSDCSVKCGHGIQTRTLFCGLSTKEGVKKVENDKCDQSKHFETIQNCTGTEECDGEWFSGPWGDCSKACGGGERTKKVVCIKDNIVVDVSHCNEEQIMPSYESCNTEACTEDSIIPVDSKDIFEEPTPKEKETTEASPSTEGDSTFSSISDKELEGTQSDFSSSDISELTKSIELSTESSDVKESEDDFEIVPADSCDDGEWIEIEKDVVGKEEEEETTETSGSTESTEPTSERIETSFSIYDVMYSDGSTTIEESPFTGSGDGPSPSTESTDSSSKSYSQTTEEEGSGSIVTEEEGTTGTYSGSTIAISGHTESATGTTQSVTGSTDSATTGPTESATGTTEPATATTESATGPTEAATGTTEISTGTTDSVTGTTESAAGTTESETETTSIEETSGSSVETTTIADIFSSSSFDLSSSSSSATESSSSSTDSSTDITSNQSEDSPSTETSSEQNTVTVDSSTPWSSTDITETTITSDSTETTETPVTDTDSTDSTETTDSTTETSISTTEGSSTDSSTTDDSTESSTVGTASTELFLIEEPDESNLPIPQPRVESKAETTIGPSTDISEEADSSSTESSSTTEFTDSSTESGSTESTESFTDSSTTEGASSTEVTSSESTKESSSTEGGSTTTESYGSTTSESYSTTTESYTSTEGSSTEVSSSTEFSTTDVSNTEIGSTTETGETFTTESTTEYTGSTETDIFSSTSETTEESSWPTTHFTEIFKKKQKMCKRKKIMQCQKSEYGCCWDNIHAAKGPFDEGCPAPKTCKESTYGCCPDGVSAALGAKNRGCPSSNCNETLFGCCWDNKTAAEGNNEEGCPPRPPACLESKWGCCKDNITEAQGPNDKGCVPDQVLLAATSQPPIECAKTEYGCCPDGSPAQGAQYQGCNLPCSNSTFGCCPNKESPAHGPNGEGCCLSSAFGCCPDDISAARGVNGEGCECRHSPYGCCPDNVTLARGYYNEGCGCKYSSYGCCPDDYTEARGPGYEGCPCHAFQFGCCPDGVSVADGPHQQGCDCRTTEFGCCSDEKTIAQGPDREGCGCETSQFGCCLDGANEAKGDNFEGCEEVPVDQQSSCSLPKERGPCRNYTVKWFYDMSYGGCSRFWYGGCDGNENRFRTKEDCEGVCVKPEGRDRCKLPKVQGSCDGYFPQWHYDKESKHCAQFIYGGCLGNNNKFEKREECAELCVTDSSVDPCEQSLDPGPCRGQFRRYYYDKESGQCQLFAYGGCKGNGNNFVSLEACRQKCSPPGKQRDYCTIPKAEGNCTNQEARWYFGAKEKRCLPFYYNGCHGNQNNFDSKETCTEHCPPEIARSTCHLPAEVGECANYVSKWYYDTKDKRCRQFYWGGCGGNGNNFETEQQCEQSCVRVEEPEEPDQPQQPDQTEQPQPEPQPDVTEPPRTARPWAGPVAPTTPYRSPTYEEVCSLTPEPGPCDRYEVRYYYDRVEGVCKNFTYGGCGGNYNNWQSTDQCLQYCGAVRTEPAQPTPAPVTEIPRPQVPPQSSSLYPECYEAADPGNCTDSYPEFYFDIQSGECISFNYTGCGGNRNRFYSVEQCHRTCGNYREQDVCNLDKEAGPCRALISKYFFNRETSRCEEFYYGGCEGNGNRFSSEQECERHCHTDEVTEQNLTATDVCQQSADQGTCPDRNLKRWYFDNVQGECKAFIYSGCGGNQNNFKNFQSCLDYCREFLPRPPEKEPDDLSPNECQENFDECNRLRCSYGVEAYVDEATNCRVCKCADPCGDVICPDGTECGIDLNTNKTSSNDADFVSVCRETNKTGQCPYSHIQKDDCGQECFTDADCTLHLKCCETSCGNTCAEPERPQELVTESYAPGYTTPVATSIYHPPAVDVKVYQPEISALIGDQAILNCAVSGNPNPNISWSKNNIIIDGTQPRYRIRLDQTLQIITLHKTDSGVYLCTAENGIGVPIQNKIALEVQDSTEPRSATILNEHDPYLQVNNVVTSFNDRATLNCYPLGWPIPAVTWWKDNEMLPLHNKDFEVTQDSSLIIHSVKISNLGVYTCQAYNGVGKAASWSVTVRATGPYHSNNPNDVKYHQYIIDSEEGRDDSRAPSPVPPSRPPHSIHRPTPEPYIPPTYSTEPNPEIDPNEIVPEIPDAEGNRIEPDISLYNVPVRANITTNDQKYPTGSTVEINCDVYGYPPPQVQWYKDGIPLAFNDRISESDSHTLTIKSTTKADSGMYQCEANNNYSRAASTIDILIEGIYIHPSCTDNQFFANCALIVKAKFCNHKYYAKFCCRSCTQAGQLPASQPPPEDQSILQNRID